MKSCGIEIHTNLLDSTCWTVALKHLESGKWLFRQKRCPGEAEVAVSTEPEAMVLVSEPFECGLVAGLMETGAGEVVVKDDHHPLLQSWSHHLQNLLHLAVQVAVHIRQAILVGSWSGASAPRLLNGQRIVV